MGCTVKPAKEIVVPRTHMTHRIIRSWRAYINVAPKIQDKIRLLPRGVAREISFDNLAEQEREKTP